MSQDQNVLLNADRALSKFNFLFHLKTKNLVILKKCNSHLQYYKIDLSFSIKLQKINDMYAKNIRPSAKRDDRITRPRRAKTCERSVLRVMKMNSRSGQIFYFKIIILQLPPIFPMLINLVLYDFDKKTPFYKVLSYV